MRVQSLQVNKGTVVICGVIILFAIFFPRLQTQLTSAKPKLSIISLGVLYSKHFLGLLFSNSTAQLN